MGGRGSCRAVMLLNGNVVNNNSDILHPKRRRPAHGVLSFPEAPTIVFVSVCTENRGKWLANKSAHQYLVDVWREASAWHVGRYVLMPDHLHFFCSPAMLDIALDNWMKYWKSLWAKKIKRSDRRWQAGYWDSRLRHGESYREKWQYVQQNPVRAGLVDVVEKWPYQGCMQELRW